MREYKNRTSNPELVEAFKDALRRLSYTGTNKVELDYKVIANLMSLPENEDTWKTIKALRHKVTKDGWLRKDPAFEGNRGRACLWIINEDISDISPFAETATYHENKTESLEDVTNMSEFEHKPEQEAEKGLRAEDEKEIAEMLGLFGIGGNTEIASLADVLNSEIKPKKSKLEDYAQEFVEDNEQLVDFLFHGYMEGVSLVKQLLQRIKELED